MNRKLLYAISSVFAMLLLLGSCSDPDYELGELTAPSNVNLTTTVVGQDEAHPYGDGSGEVKISVEGDNALAYKIDFGTNPTLNFVPFKGEITRKYTSTGVNDYKITVVAYGEGGSATNVTKNVTVRSDFTPDPEIVTALTGDASKTWTIEGAVPGHFGVGPWSGASVTPEWYAAGPNEKADCCNCFYTATFTFSKNADGTFALQANTPDGAFTKTGALAGGLPGIPGSGDEGCYDYVGGTSSFSFSPAASGVSADVSTGTNISISGDETFIGYGAVLNDYEIMEITPDNLYLRVQGTETGNAWYLRLIPVSAAE